MEKGYICSTCGKYHDELPMDFGFNAPFYWNDKLKEDPSKNELTSDFCVVDGKDFFIRVVLEIPVDEGKTFNWGVWVSLSEKNFHRYNEVYGTEAELKEEPYFGWFSNQLSQYGYPDSLQIKTKIHLEGNKLRPKLELDHSNNHPICQEQHNGITMARVHEIIETVMGKLPNQK